MSQTDLNTSSSVGSTGNGAWRNMDSAPQDGTRILVYDADDVYIVSWLNVTTHRHPRHTLMAWAIPESWQDEQGGYTIIDSPLGWMPTPPTRTHTKPIATDPAVAAYEVIAAYEFDQFSGNTQKIEVREEADGYIKVVLCGNEETQLFGATLDQWGTWYDAHNHAIIAQEWGTRSFLGALIAALEKFKSRAEIETLPPTELNIANTPDTP